MFNELVETGLEATQRRVDGVKELITDVVELLKCKGVEVTTMPFYRLSYDRPYAIEMRVTQHGVLRVLAAFFISGPIEVDSRDGRQARSFRNQAGATIRHYTRAELNIRESLVRTLSYE